MAKHCEVREVVVDRKVLAGFRRRAKAAYPNEYIEGMFGKTSSDGITEIHIIAHVPHESSPDNCIFAVSEINSLKDEAEEIGMELVGLIHSHPGNNTCIHPSELDHECHLAMGILLIGTMFIRSVKGRLRSDVEFNVPRKPVIVKLVSLKR